MIVLLRGTRRVFLPWVKKIFLIVSKSLLITRNANDDILVRLRPEKFNLGMLQLKTRYSNHVHIFIGCATHHNN